MWSTSSDHEVVVECGLISVLFRERGADRDLGVIDMDHLIVKFVVCVIVYSN